MIAPTATIASLSALTMAAGAWPLRARRKIV